MVITLYAWPLRMSKNSVTILRAQFNLRKPTHVELKNIFLCLLVKSHCKDWPRTASFRDHMPPPILFSFHREFSAVVVNETDSQRKLLQGYCTRRLNASREAILVASTVTKYGSSRTNNITFSRFRFSRASIPVYSLLQTFFSDIQSVTFACVVQKNTEGPLYGILSTIQTPLLGASGHL